MSNNTKKSTSNWTGDWLPKAKCNPPKRGETVYVPRGRTSFFTMVDPDKGKWR